MTAPSGKVECVLRDLGWGWYQDCPESGQWYKFNAAGESIAREGDKVWERDFAKAGGGRHGTDR